MKKIFPIGASLIFLFGSAGYYLAFVGTEANIKNKMTEVIESSEKNQILHFTFSLNDLQREVKFTENSMREFIYNGIHYDVIESNRIGNQISVFCLEDKNETALFDAFGKQLNEQSSSNNTSGRPEAKPVAQDWFFELTNISAIFFSTLSLQTVFQFPSSNSIEEILAPPPRA